MAIQKIKNFTLIIVKIVISLVTIILFIGFFRWTGFKGLISFMLGMLIMAFLILSKNPILLSIIAMTQSEDFIDSIMKKDEK